MRSEAALQIGQKKRATLAGVHLDAWTAPAGALVPCPVCGLIFKKKRLKHYFNTSQCRFRFWDRQRMDFRVINRKLDIIIEKLEAR
jgi:hypothetical protein